MTKYVIVGEAWGREEAEALAPFVGASGKLLYAMLAQAGIPKSECFFTNVFNFQPKGTYPDNDLRNVCGPKAESIPGTPMLQRSKYVHKRFAPEVERLFREIENEAPDLIIALGATAAWALLGTSGIRKIRGAPALSERFNVKVLPTYHPTAVLREWTLRPIVIADLIKARAEGEFRELIRPQRSIWIEPAIADLERFEREHFTNATALSVDIETKGDIITCVGFAPSDAVAIVVPFYDAVRSDGNYWRSTAEELAAWEFVRRWCAMTIPLDIRQRMGYYPELRHLPGIGQNHLYDIHRLWRSMGILLHADDDTMLLHHALQPEMEKGLGYLASIYTDELPWKFMRTANETLKKED